METIRTGVQGEKFSVEKILCRPIWDILSAENFSAEKTTRPVKPGEAHVKAHVKAPINAPVKAPVQAPAKAPVKANI